MRTLIKIFLACSVAANSCLIGVWVTGVCQRFQALEQHVIDQRAFNQVTVQHVVNLYGMRGMNAAALSEGDDSI